MGVEVIAQYLDQVLALGVAVWVINIGVKQLKDLQAQYVEIQKEHAETTERVLGQQQENNRQLMDLVSNLCINVTKPKE